MDKYEYRIRAEEINALIDKKQFAEAGRIADTIDWRRVKSVTMLCKVSELYKISRRYEDSRDILLLAYDRQPESRRIVYNLCELSIKLEELIPALEYYKEFVQIAPRDTGRFILQYKLYEAQDVSLEERIAVLEEYKKRDYREKWAYELAYLYHRIGLATRCVEECDELILWFGEGKYVIKAMELKMLHAPLTQSQQEKYDHRFEEKAPTDEVIEEQIYEEAMAENSIDTEDADDLRKDKPRAKLSVTTDTIPDMPIQIRSVDVSGAPTQRIPSKNKDMQEEDIAEDQAYVGAEDSYESTGTENYEDDNYPEEGYGEEAAPDDGSYEEELTIDLPEMPIAPVPDDMDIHIKTIDMSKFNTMDLQAELAQNLADLMQQEDMEANDATKALPLSAIDKALAAREESLNKNGGDGVWFREETEEAEAAEETVEETEEITEETAVPEEAVEEEIPEEIPEEIDEGIEELTEIEDEVPDKEVEEESEKEPEESFTPLAEAVKNVSEPEPVEEDDLNALAAAALEQMNAEEENAEEDKEEGTDLNALATAALEQMNAEENKEEAVPESVPEKEEAKEDEPEPTKQWKGSDIEAAVGESRVTPEVVDEVVKTIGIRQHSTITEEDLLNSMDEEAREQIEAAAEEAKEDEEAEAAEEEKELQFIPVSRPKAEEEPAEEETVPEEAAPEEEKAVEEPVEEVEEEKEVEPEAKDDLTDAEKANLDEQITGQLSFQDIMAGWEQTKKENEEKHIEEMRQQILKQTGPMMSDFVKKEDNGLNIIAPTLNVFENKPRPDEKVFTMEDTSDAGASDKKSSVMNTAEINGLEEKLISSMADDAAGITGLENDERVAKMQEEARSSIEETINLDEFEDIGRSVFESFSPTPAPATEEKAEVKPETESAEEKSEPVSSTAELEQIVSEALDEDTKEKEEPEKPKSIYDELRPKDSGEYKSEEKPASIYDALKPKESIEPKAEEKPASIYDSLKPKDSGETKSEEKPIIDVKSDPVKMSTAEIKSVIANATSEPFVPTSAAEAVAAMKAAKEAQKPKANTQDLVNALGEFDIGNTEPPVGGNTGFIIRDLTKPVEDLATEQPEMKAPPQLGPDGKRLLTAEEKEMFSSIATTKEVQDQIAFTIDNMSLTPVTGNIRITGEKGGGTIDTAKNLIKILSANRPDFSGKVAKISGELLNSKGVIDTLKSVEGGALIIDEAGSMNDMTLYGLADYINNPASANVLLILEDRKKDMDLLFANPAAPKQAFNLSIDIETLDNNGLVSYGKQYANEHDYAIDEMGTLALYTRISEMQTNTHSVTVEEVREIIDEAIKKADKKNVGHFMDVILAKRYNTQDMVVLREKDFLK